MKQNIYKIFSLAALALLPISLSAQALPFVAVNYDPATLAKGGASLVETSSVAYSSFGNVASVPFSKCAADLGAGYTMWAPDGVPSNILNVAGAFNLKDKFGVTAGIAYGMGQAYDITDDNGAVKGQFKPNEMQVNAGFAYRFLPYLSAGVNVGYASAKLSDAVSYGSVTADVYLMAVLKNGFKAAVGVSDLGGGVVAASDTKFSLPSAGTAGVGYDMDLTDMHRISLQADAEYYFAGAFAAAVGAEYSLKNLVALRAGYRYGGESVLPSFVSVGAGVHLAGFRIDAAYVLGNDIIGNTLSLSIGYSL